MGRRGGDESRRGAPAGSGPSCWARGCCAILIPRRWRMHSREGLQRAGLAAIPWSDGFVRLRERLAFLHRVDGASWPDVSDAALLDSPRALAGAPRGAAARHSPISAASISRHCNWPTSPGSSGRRSTLTRQPTSRYRAGRGCRSTMPTRLTGAGGAAAGDVRARGDAADRARSRAPHAAPALAGAPAGAGDARPWRILALELSRRAEGPAGPLSEACRGRRIRSPSHRRGGPSRGRR